jgi:hypothetical protein
MGMHRVSTCRTSHEVGKSATPIAGVSFDERDNGTQSPARSQLKGSSGEGPRRPCDAACELGVLQFTT